MLKYFGSEWLIVAIALGCLLLVLVMEWIRDWWQAMGGSASDWETTCPKRDDQLHCNCWYDGEACCACGDPAHQPCGNYPACGDPACDVAARDTVSKFFVDGKETP